MYRVMAFFARFWYTHSQYRGLWVSHIESRQECHSDHPTDDANEVMPSRTKKIGVSIKLAHESTNTASFITTAHEKHHHITFYYSTER